MQAPMNEEERAERAARIQERAAKTRLMPDESGQLVKHKQADDGRWLPIEKKPGQTPTRNRPIQVSTAAHAKKPSAMPYLMLGATAAILGLGAFIALPYLSNTASESSTTPLSTPQQVAQRAAPRPIFWLEAGADRVGAGFLIEKQLVACDAALLDDRLLREFRLRSPEDSRGNRGRSCQLQAIDAELGVALLRIRGVEKPFAKLADEPPAEGTPVRFLSPKYDAHRNDVDLDESAGFMGESFLSGEKTLYHIELAHSGEQTGSPVLSIDDDLLGLLCYQIQNDVATLVPTEELRAFALAAQKLGPSYGLQLEAQTRRRGARQPIDGCGRQVWGCGSRARHDPAEVCSARAGSGDGPTAGTRRTLELHRRSRCPAGAGARRAGRRADGAPRADT
jgi:hypothetical protein